MNSSVKPSFSFVERNEKTCRHVRRYGCMCMCVQGEGIGATQQTMDYLTTTALTPAFVARLNTVSRSRSNCRDKSPTHESMKTEDSSERSPHRGGGARDLGNAGGIGSFLDWRSCRSLLLWRNEDFLFSLPPCRSPPQLIFAPGSLCFCYFATIYVCVFPQIMFDALSKITYTAY